MGSKRWHVLVNTTWSITVSRLLWGNEIVFQALLHFITHFITLSNSTLCFFLVGSQLLGQTTCQPAISTHTHGVCISFWFQKIMISVESCHQRYHIQGRNKGLMELTCGCRFITSDVLTVPWKMGRWLAAYYYYYYYHCISGNPVQQVCILWLIGNCISVEVRKLNNFQANGKYLKKPLWFDHINDEWVKRIEN